MKAVPQPWQAVPPDVPGHCVLERLLAQTRGGSVFWISCTTSSIT